MARRRPIAQRDRALELAEELVLMAPDRDCRDLALALRARIRIPMTQILAKMPGESIAEKARTLSIQRSTYYAWAEGRARPRRGLAEKVAALTGFSWQEVAGYPSAAAFGEFVYRASEHA